jgi:thymidine kinase
LTAACLNIFPLQNSKKIYILCGDSTKTMDLDDNMFHLPYGWDALIYGSMFSGKTELLVTTLRRVKNYSGLRVQVFKPVIDNRYGENVVSTHDGINIPAIQVYSVAEMKSLIKKDTQVIGVSETQFFDDAIIEFCEEEKALGRKILLEGLVLDYKKEPFQFINKSGRTMQDLLSHVYPVLKTAMCYKCGKPAMYTMRISHSKELVLIGDKKDYCAACDEHHKIPE